MKSLLIESANKNYNLWPCQNVCEALVYLLDNSIIRFGTKVYRQTLGNLMGTKCAPLLRICVCFVTKAIS